MAENDRGKSARTVARLKAGVIRSQPNKHSKARTRNPDGTPVQYNSIKNDALSQCNPHDRRVSRSLSDPDIPGFLVISGEEGLFANKKFAKSKGTFGKTDSIDIKAADRPVFWENPLQDEQECFGDIRSRFEFASSMDSQDVGDFINPLHKGNRKKPGGITPNSVKPPAVPNSTKTENSEDGKGDSDVSSASKPVVAKKPSPAPKPVTPVKPALSSKPVIPIKPVIAPKPKGSPILNSKRDSPVKISTKESSNELNLSSKTVSKEKSETTDSMAPKMPSYPPPPLPVNQKPKLSETKGIVEQNVKDNVKEGALSGSEKPESNEGIICDHQNSVECRNLRSESDPTPLDYSLKTGTKFYLDEKQSIITEEDEENKRDSNFYVNVDTSKINSVEECIYANVNSAIVKSEEVTGAENPVDDNRVSYDDGDVNDDDEGWGSEEFEDDDIDDDDVIQSQGGTTEEEPLVFPDTKSKKLYNIASEILSTERAYVNKLHLLDKVFYHRLDSECCAQGHVSTEVLQEIFSNIGAIHSLHRDFFLPKLEERMSQWSTNNTIGDILKSIAPFLKLYVAYIANFEKANETLTAWMKKSTKFAAIVEEIQKTRESENLTLQHHMLGPIQRVPRYKLLLTDYINKLAEDSPDLKNTQDALDIIATAARHANDSMKKTERFKMLLDIQERLMEEFDLITASREFIKEGDLVKVAARSQAGHQERTLLLFNDTLLCCSKFAGTNKLKVKVAMDLEGMEINDAIEDVKLPHSFRITSKQRVIDFSASSEEERAEWMKSLNEAISEFMRKRDSYRRTSQVHVMSDRELGTKAPAWVRDESVTMCMLCDSLFTLTRRRHHCRACGRIYCNSCCHNKAPLEYCGGKHMRVCQTCYKVLVRGFKERSVRKKINQAHSMDTRKLSIGSKVLMSGFLGYRGGSDKHWFRRWCVVSDNFVLYFYKGKKDTKAAFSLPLPGYTVDKPNLADDVGDKKLAFKLHHKNVVVHFLAADDEDSLKRWTYHLSYAVKAETAPEDKPMGPEELKERSCSL